MLCNILKVMLEFTSLMSMRPAIVRRVRGEKCGVIMTRSPASGNESWCGLEMSSSSTITTEDSCPEPAGAENKNKNRFCFRTQTSHWTFML